MGFSIKRTGFTDIDALARAIVTDMIAAGFVLSFPAQMSSSAKSFTLRAGPTVDPLAATQPWCVKLFWDKGADGKVPAATGGGVLDFIVATPSQFKDDVHATYERFTGVNSGSSVQVGVTRDAVGLLGTATGRARTEQQSTSKDMGFGDRTFIDRQRYLVAQGENMAYPMSYRLSVSDRGFLLAVWEEGHDREANRYSWVVVQRPVDNKSGQVYATGKSPVHCIYGLANVKYIPAPQNDADERYNIRRFVVREQDINKPYPLAPISATWPVLENGKELMGVDAIIHSRDYTGVINASQQVAISENNKYILTFPNGLNTARYAYPHELDMLAYTSADVVSEGTIVPVTVYGESTPRKYIALGANGPNNTGMRILALIEGGGVTPAPGGSAG